LNRNDLHAEIAPKRVGIASVRGVHVGAPTREKRDWRDLVRTVDVTAILTRSIKSFRSRSIDPIF
jgi:hypothetical protein